MDSNRRNYLVPKLNPQEMKEKIKKIHDKYTAPCKYGITSSDLDLVSQEIEHLVNLEVEKRIAERMPSEEEQDKWADYVAGNTTADHNMAVLYKAALSLGATWLRSRLTNQKTEGGGE